MKNILKVLFVLIFTLAMMMSCDFGHDRDSGVSDGNGGWPGVFVAYYRGNADISTQNLENRFSSETNVELSLYGGDEDDNLFIVGEHDSALSKRAYWKMDRDFTYDENNTIFTICSDGTSVAIAYESEVALYAALDYFFTEFYNLDLTKSGTVVSKEFNVASYVNEIHIASRDEAFKALEGQLSEGAIDALRTMYTLYDERVYYWLVNLWDPDVGGFYYSNSGRDTIGFLPDLESTAQALLFLSDSGMISDYNNKYKDALPTEVADAILNYTKNCQNPEDGYFYHEQWGDSVNSSRLGRDLGWATRIISGLGSIPYWNTPNGVRGEYGKPGSSSTSVSSSFNTSSISLLGTLGTGADVTASKIIPTAAPKYLTDVALFLEHLEKDYDWENDSYTAGNDIESELGQIQNAGSEFTEALIDFLNKKQKSNGLWESEVSYASINGLMKISGVYTSLKKVIPNADKAMDSAILMLKSDKEPSHVCSVYNPWEAVANILITIERISGKADADKLRAQFRAEAEDLIKITFDKLSIFKKNDGGFSYYIRFSSSTSQGAPVALSNAAESDVNATMICTNSIITSIFDVFGIERVDRYYPIDFASFSDTLNELGTILKDDLPETGSITFDDYDPESKTAL